MEGYVFCGTKDCTACKHLQEMDYLRSPKAAADRLQALIDKRTSPMAFGKPIITEAFDWEYQEWVDNELLMKGEPA